MLGHGRTRRGLRGAARSTTSAANASDSAISLQPTGPSGSISKRGVCTRANQEPIIASVSSRPIARVAADANVVDSRLAAEYASNRDVTFNDGATAQPHDAADPAEQVGFITGNAADHNGRPRLDLRAARGGQAGVRLCAMLMPALSEATNAGSAMSPPATHGAESALCGGQAERQTFHLCTRFDVLGNFSAPGAEKAPQLDVAL